MPLQTSASLIDEIKSLAPPGLAELDSGTLAALRGVTRRLIATMKSEGRLSENPIELAMTRNVALHQEAALKRLKGRRVMVIGGAGCVGTRLRTLLASFEPQALVSLDLVAHSGLGSGIQVDIRDAAALDAAFAELRPEVVFHLAAIREPGRAEVVVRDAVETNVYGTANVIAACQRHGVAQAVYSSTGKCFAYITDHVYTATKKLAEAQWMAAARQDGPTRFVTTRFTHVLENGVVARDIAQGIMSGLVGLHGADRHFNLQNLRQATHLLVNAVALAGEQASDSFWSAIDLGWPVNTLEMALYQIDRGGQDVAVRFSGVPRGYDEQFFRGQFDWSGEHEYHPLINALEAPSNFTDSTGTMIGARVSACPEDLLRRELHRLRQVLDENPREGGFVADAVVKRALLDAVAGLAAAIFASSDPLRLLDILWWGAAPNWAGPKAATAQRFAPVLARLADALVQKAEALHGACGAQDKALDVAGTFRQIPGLEDKARSLRAAFDLAVVG
ncbi:polysaccharide biosynthesis protein [Roseomonas sp. E05]|uniref:polysaccharide biosynthesis protein n=1 Tax=Roseomonas sp. E05 TaxID=3046310 RepID=UPI0024BA6762|nr:polysaccharide biosynthesis protein [Roseomonas sp. E05]MDJ0389864.1 polysaccharide biosynthesis protein [Roseomonas sp. E05]